MSEECVVSKVLDVDKMKQSLSSFSFSKEDTEFKPPKKTKGGRDSGHPFIPCKKERSYLILLECPVEKH